MLTPHQGFTYNKFDKPNDWPELSSTFDYKIEDGKLFAANENIKLSGPVGYTVVGSPTIENGIASGFSMNDYLKLNGANVLSNANSWEIVIKIVNNGGSYFIGTNLERILTVSAGTSRFFLSSDGINWDIAGGIGNNKPLPDNSYVRLQFTGTKYILDYSIDKIDWVECGSVYSSVKISSSLSYLKIGWWYSAEYGFTGSIDLNETYIKVNNQLWFGKKYRQYEASNGVVTKNTVPVPEGLVIGNFTTPSNGMFDIVTQTFEPFEYYPIIKTDSNMLQVESKQNIGEVNYTVVGSPTIVDGVVSGFSSSDFINSSSVLSDENEIYFSTSIHTTSSLKRSVILYWHTMTISILSNGKLELNFKDNISGDWITITSSNTISINSDYVVNVFKSNSSVTVSIGDTSYIDAQNISLYGNNTRVNYGSNYDNNYFNGSIDLNNTYIKVNGQVWFGKQKPEAKLVGPVGYTKVGSPTITNGIASGFSADNYLLINDVPSSVTSFEIATKFNVTQLPDNYTYNTLYGQYSSNMSAPQLMLNDGHITYSHPLGTAWGNWINYNISANTDYWIVVNWDNSGTTTMKVSTDGINYITAGTVTNNTLSWTDKIAIGVDYQTGTQVMDAIFNTGIIDLSQSYIKVNGALWFGKENWTPCIFDDNSIVELVGHKADYSSYNTCALSSAIQNSGTYDVWIDNQKVYENVTSATQTDINWSNLALTTGYSVTTPESLKAHILKITPSNKENKFTGFRNTVSSYTSTGTEYTGVLQIHFELDYELGLQHLTNQQVSPNTISRLLYAVTSKTNELITSSLADSFASTRVRRIPKIKSSAGFVSLSRAFAFIQNSLKYANIDSGLLQFYAFSQSSALEKLDGNYGVGSSATAVLQQVPALKQLPNISNITAANLTNYITNASSLQPTDVDLSNKDDLTKLDIHGSSSNRMDGLKSLKVSNEAPFTGTSPQINISYTGLEKNALVELFNSLPYNVGYTVVGSPTITDGVVSGFSTDDYLTLSSNTIPTNSAVEIKMRIKTPPSSSTDVFVGFGAIQTICWLAMVEGTNKIAFRASSYGGALTFVSATVNFNTEYDILLKYSKGTYATLGVKLPSETEYQTTTGDLLFDESSFPSIDEYFVIRMLGRATSSAYPRPLNGSIDLNNTYIKVNGVPFFTGTAAITKTIDITGCSGTNSLTNDEIAIATNKGWTVTGAN